MLGLLAWLLGSARGAAQTALHIEGSGRQITLLVGTSRTSELEQSRATEVTTFVPDCRLYQDLPCDCEHVLLSPAANGFWPGFDHLWHLPSVQRLLTIQQVYHRYELSIKRLSKRYWHASALGNFKNSLDVSYLLAGAYAIYHFEACFGDPGCLLTQGLAVMLEWLLTLLLAALFRDTTQVQGLSSYLRTLEDSAKVATWKGAPFYMLLNNAFWAETFVYVTGQLESMAINRDIFSARLPEDNVDEEERFQRSMANIGVDLDKDCQQLVHWRRMASAAKDDKELSYALRMIQEEVMHPSCYNRFFEAMAIFGASVRQFLPRLPPNAWLSVGPAQPAELPSLWRLCRQPNLSQRRVGRAELHFMAADVVLHEGELQLDLLWTATSDDDCIMASGAFHNSNESYYSFMHTLPHAHLVHWVCIFEPQDAKEVYHELAPAAATTSFSGFTSVSTCRIPGNLVAEAFGTSRTGAAASIGLRLDGGSWSPEPLRLCPVPRRPRRRRLSACTSTMHDADYVQSILPHAVEDWINYHLAIGIEHFTVFDTDGSYEPYLQPFVDRGFVSYHPRFPWEMSSKLGLAATQATPRNERRPMLLEPHAIELCVWENRQVSDWVVVIHNMEEYLHSPILGKKLPAVKLPELIKTWAAEVPMVAIFEIFQEPMGGAGRDGGATIFSRWTHKRGLEFSEDPGHKGAEEDAVHFQPFAFIVDPVNVLQTAVHVAQARGEDHAIMALSKDNLRMNHYLDLGSNRSRCLEELGGCHVLDESLIWAEELVLRLRTPE